MGDRRIRVIIFGHKSSGKTTALEKIIQLNLEKTPHQKVEGVTTGKTVGGGRACIYETEMSSYEFLEAPSYDDHACGTMNIAKKGNIAVLLISARDGDISETEKLHQITVFTHLILNLGMRNILVVINKIDANGCNKDRTDAQLKCIANIIHDQYDLGSQIVLIRATVSFEANQHIQKFFDGLDKFKVTAHGDSTPRLRIKNDDKVGSFVQKWVDVDLLLDENPTNVNHWDDRAHILFELAKLKWIHHSAWFTAATKANKCKSLRYTPKEKAAFAFVIKGHEDAEKNNLQDAKNSYEKAREIFKKIPNGLASSSVNLILIELEKRRKKVSQEREEMEEMEEINVVETEEKKNRKKSKKKKKNKGKNDVSDVVGLKKCEEKKEVVEQEKYEEEKDEVRAKEDEKADTILHATSSSTYQISLTMSNSCCRRMRRMGNDICLPQSFIPCTNIQVEKFAEVVSIGFKKSSILTVSDIVQVKIDGEEKPFFVTEPVQPLDSYFQLEYEKWCSAEGRPGDLSKWWSFIKDKFQSIYCDVIEVLLYLYSEGSACGDLCAVQDVIYITDDEHPRILPSMNPEATSVKDVEDLSKNMRGIINIPCAGEKSSVHKLSDDLSHLFKWFKMKLSPRCVLNHYFFWKPQERIDFIFRVKKYMITNLVLMKDLNHSLTDGEAKEGLTWKDKVKEKGGVFNEIFKKGDPSHPKLLRNDQIKEARLIQVRSYTDKIDVLRYIVAVYTHYNDMEYKDYRPERLDDVDIEVEVRRLFPRIYAEVLNSFKHLPESVVMPLLRPRDKLMV